MFHYLALSTLGAGALAGHALLGRKPPTLVEQLAPSSATLLDPKKNNQKVDDDEEQRSSILSRPLESSHAARHFALSVSLLGLTTVGTLGLPLLCLLSLPGLLYLDFYFLRMAYCKWRETQRVSIETNDAALATGLLVTHQLGAGALFATFFFTSRLLQEQTDAGLAQEDATITQQVETGMPPVTSPPRPPAPEVAEPVDDAHWRSQIDQGSLPLLALSAISTPFLGLHRSLSVLVANFGYDYRVIAPLSTLTCLRRAKAQGIWVRSGQVFEQLGKIDVLLIEYDGDLETALPSMRNLPDTITVHHVSPEDVKTTTQIAQWQQEGHTVAYISLTLKNATAIAQADVVITWGHQPIAAAETMASAHVILDANQLAHLQQLLTLTQGLRVKHQQSLALAFVPSLINLVGIYFWHFGPVTALLVDYGGLGVEVLNAVKPPEDKGDTVYA